jgi:hypothetical protein
MNAAQHDYERTEPRRPDEWTLTTAIAPSLPGLGPADLIRAAHEVQADQERDSPVEGRLPPEVYRLALCDFLAARIAGLLSNIVAEVDASDTFAAYLEQAEFDWARTISAARALYVAKEK